MLIVDYYSRFIEISKLASITSAEVIQHTKSIFARHGIPEEIVTDNGTQYSSEAFALFSQEYKFSHITSSPLYPLSNGEAERAVKTVKQLLDKNEDPYLALLSYRSTSIRNGYSPSELLMGRKIRTTLPQVLKQLKPKLPNQMVLRERETVDRNLRKRNFDSRHKAKEQSLLEIGQDVWIRDLKKRGQVVGITSYPRSYYVRTDIGAYRRNRTHLVCIFLTSDTTDQFIEFNDPIQTGTESSNENNQQLESNSPNCNEHQTVTRSGRISRPPNRLEYLTMN